MSPSGAVGGADGSLAPPAPCERGQICSPRRRIGIILGAATWRDTLTSRTRFAALVVIAAAWTHVHADEISHTQTFPLAPSPWVIPVDLPAFDPGMGQLQATNLSLTVHMEGGVAVENILTFPMFALISGGGSARFELLDALTYLPATCNWVPAADGGPPFCELEVMQTGDSFVEAFDGNLDYTGVSAATFGFLGDMVATAGTTFGVNGANNPLSGGQLVLTTFGHEYLSGPSGVVWDPISHETSAELTVTYVFGAATWNQNAGPGLAGLFGVPELEGEGTLQGNSPLTLRLDSAFANASASLLVGPTALNMPFKGGVLVPNFAPPGFILQLSTDVFGELELAGTWPAGVPANTTIYFQYWIADPLGPAGLSASNAIVGTAQ